MRIREAHLGDAGPMARIHIDTWRTTYAGLIPAEFLAGMSYQDREARWVDILEASRPATNNFVAETDGGKIVGFAGGGPERDGNRTYLGEMYAIYLSQQHQRKGFGRHLVAAVTQHLRLDGFESMLVWVLKDNHAACQSYESLGGVLVGRKEDTIGGAKLKEVSYGWKDTSELTMEHAL